MDTPSPYMTSKEAAQYLRLSPKSFANLRGEIPAVNAVGRPLFVRADLDAWLANRGRVPAKKSRRRKSASK